MSLSDGVSKLQPESQVTCNGSSGNHPQNNHFDLDHFYMRKLAIFGLFEYIQYGHKVKIIDSNIVANTGAQKNGQSAVFGVILALWRQVSDFEG